jgi:YaiO family outer membrane protein
VTAGAALFFCLASPSAAQTIRLAGWGSYESVTASQDWSSVGGQLSIATSAGHGGWLRVEGVSRFGESDVTERIGVVFHARPRLWLTAEASTAAKPLFMPKNQWDVGLAALLAPRVSAGVSYRRSNYSAGAVDIVIPNFSVQSGGIGWDVHAYISRNPTDRTDAAAMVRATRPVSRRAAIWALGGAGRESYSIGTMIASLKTVTGAAGLRYNAASGWTVRLDATVIRSRPVLSRRGISIGLESVL